MILDNATLLQASYSMLDSTYSTIRQTIVGFHQRIQQMVADPVDHSMPDTQPVSDSSDINSILGPHELLRIFDCLSPSDVLGGAALVCKRWCALYPSDADLAAHLKCNKLSHTAATR
jgi:F-box-like